jgi:hypothetical protein
MRRHISHQYEINSMRLRTSFQPQTLVSRRQLAIQQRIPLHLNTHPLSYPSTLSSSSDGRNLIDPSSGASFKAAGANWYAVIHVLIVASGRYGVLGRVLPTRP